MRSTFLAALLLLSACGGEAQLEPVSPETPSPTYLAGTPSDPAAAWSGTIAYEAGVKLGGCDVGDLDPSSPGMEIAAVAVDGRVFLVHRSAGEWQGKEIAQVDGEMIQCAIGDADPTRPGNELVIVGMKQGTEGAGGSGQAHLVFHRDGAWHVEPVFEDTALLHGVCIGDLTAEHDGNEVVAVGFSQKATVLAREQDGWHTLAQVDLGSPGKTATVVRTAAMVACAGGTVTAVHRNQEGWRADPFALEGAGPARITSDGHDLLVACDDGGLRLIASDGAEVIHQESKKLRGAVLADLDPLVDGTEAATAGYEKTITLLYPPTEAGGAWTPITLWRDSDRFHHLAAGELSEEGVGLELVAVGYSGRVIVAARTRP